MVAGAAEQEGEGEGELASPPVERQRLVRLSYSSTSAANFRLD